MDADGDEELRLDEDLKFNRGVFNSYSSSQKDFGEQLCADIGSRGEQVVEVVEESGVIVVILSEEYLLSRPLMFELEAIVNYKRGNAYVRIIPAYYGLSSKQCRDDQSRWLKVWIEWAKSDSRIVVKKWYRALVELDQIAGHCLDINSEVMYRKIIIDNVCDLINVVSRDYKTEVSIIESRYVGGQLVKRVRAGDQPMIRRRRLSSSVAWKTAFVLPETTIEMSSILMGFLPNRGFYRQWTAVWQKLARCDSRIDVQKWCRAFIEISSSSGLPACGTSGTIDRQTAVDAIREMAAIMKKNPELVQFTLRHHRDLKRISRDQNSMERLRERVVICSTQSDFLITKIQRLSSNIEDEILAALILKFRDLQYQEHEAAYALLDRFRCIMVAAEDLLDLCAKEDLKLAAISVFLPASCAPCHSKFALVARDLDYTYHMLLSLLEVETAQNYTLMGTTITDASNQDRSDVLPKLEGELSKGLGHRDIYCSLLMRRFQADASPSTSGPVPVCFWIPGELKYSYLRTVASGNFKSVLKCQWLGLDVAIASYTGEYAKNDLEAEAGILASVQHPNVVSMFGCAYDEKKKEGYLVTELMELDLRHLISERGKSRGDGEMPFSESVARDIILQIVEAMIHVHKCRVLHRDLKPSNCVVSVKKRIRQIDWRPETYYVVKLIDFGSAKVRGAYASTCHTRKQGTPAYMAPELHAEKEKCAYKWSADVYSLGMTMYEIFTGKSPFEGVYRGGELVRRVCAGERPSLPEYVPVFWQQLMEKCWHRDPEQRPTFAWIRLEILRGITSAAGDPVSAWRRFVDMPSEIREEFLENSEGFLVNPSLFYRIKSSSIGAWNTIKSIIF